VPIADSVVRSSARITGAAGFGVSSRSLVYIPGLGSSPTQTDFELRLTDPTGQFEHLKLPRGRYSTPRVSPDGTRLALGVQDGNQARIAIYDLSGVTGLRHLTLTGNNRFPIWSRDSKRLTFQSDREGDLALFHMPVDGGPVVRLTTPDPGDAHEPEDWSPMTDTLLFSVTKKRDVSLWTRSSPGDKSAVWQRALDLPNRRAVLARRTMGRLLGPGGGPGPDLRRSVPGIRNDGRRARAPHQR
jgi:Tol biopolymer transport system component